MPIHLAARVHAFWHGLFRPSDEVETRELYDHVQRLFGVHELGTTSAREEFISELSIDTLKNFGCDEDHPQIRVVNRLIHRLFDYENLFVLPAIDWQIRRSITQYWEIRDHLNVQRKILEDFSTTRHLLVNVISAFLDPVYESCPYLLDHDDDPQDLTVDTHLLYNLGDIKSVAEAVLNVGLAEELREAELFTRLSERLISNIVEASGGNPRDPGNFSKAPKFPTKSDIKHPEELLDTYLGGTPLLNLFDQSITFKIPTRSRFEHHHIVAGSGHGKTQTLQYLIAKDLEAVAGGNRTVVVIDSQGDLIRNISNLEEFSSDGALHNRIVIIDPTDVEWPVSLNLFDVGIERLSGYAPLERERLTNSILELYDFVLGTLLSAEMTQKQSVIFRYVTRLMLHIPNATIHTLRELMEPNSHIKFAEHIDKLEGTARHFFETEFSSREFEQTKKQVLRRLWGILENQTFERMFSHPKSKLDLFSEMNTGKVILINTAKDLLKEQGTEIFGRFFIAMIAQAAQERATLPDQKRMPTIVYIDEAADYFDRNINIILSQARKYNVGMVLAHQYLGQLDSKLQEAVSANTSIKFAGGVSAKDARTLAPMFYTDPELIERQQKGSFAAYVRGVTKSAIPLQFPLGHMESMDKMSEKERELLQGHMRERYATHYSELKEGAETDIQPESPKNSSDNPKRSDDDSYTGAGDSW